jgi:hypothetical protein
MTPFYPTDGAYIHDFFVFLQGSSDNSRRSVPLLIRSKNNEECQLPKHGMFTGAKNQIRKHHWPRIRWNDAAKAFWEPTLIHLRQADKTILLGAGLSLPGRQQSYLNAAVILGSYPASPFIQRIPVPIAIWKPITTKDGVPLPLLGAGTAIVADQRAAILICSEQLLIWPVIISALERPNILIGTANDSWAAGTPIPAVQNACL